MSALVITNCTGRKRLRPGVPPVSLPSRLPGRSTQDGIQALASAWSSLLNNHEAAAIPAADLYVGRAFSDATSVAASLGAGLAVVSAGCGFVGGSEPVPPYELTVADGPGSIQPRLAALGVTVRAWWSALNVSRGRTPLPLSSRLTEAGFGLVLIALPASYIELIAEDLEAIPTVMLSTIRVFTSPAGRHALPERLQDQVLPYDERLDGDGSSRLGTRIDFPQRAMRHYVEDLGAASHSIAEGKEAVARALSALIRPAVPERRRATDQEIRELLHLNWLVHRGQSSRLLRFLRDDALVACEQSRFRTLWGQVRGERAPDTVGEA